MRNIDKQKGGNIDNILTGIIMGILWVIIAILGGRNSE